MDSIAYIEVPSTHQDNSNSTTDAKENFIIALFVVVFDTKRGS